jgi:hypothetical protein
MPGSIWSSIDPATTSGNQLATLLNDLKDIIVSGFRGTSRPTNLQAGGYWIDTTNEGSPNFYWDIKLYTGTTDIKLFRIDLAGNTSSIDGASNTFTVSRFTADTVGPVLELVKRRVANNGQVLDGDVIGELKFIGRGNDSSNPVVARVRSIASDNMTASATGAYLAFEVVEDATATLAEVARIIDKKFAVNTTSPQNTIHAVGTGIRSENKTDTTTGSKFISKKSRISGTGAVQSGDIISVHEFQSTDETTSDILAAKIEVEATENHSTTAVGTRMKVSVTKTGQTTPTEKIRIDDKIALKERVSIEALELEYQDVATAASITALSATKSIVKLTGSTATSLKGIDATGNAKVLLLHNESTADVTIEEEDAGATATNRFSLPNATDITLSPDTSIEFFYSTTESRWKLKSGSGSGGGGTYVVSSEQTVTAGGTVTTTTFNSRQLRPVKGDTGGVSASTTPFGSGGGWIDGTEVTLVGTNADDYLEVSYNDASYGVIGNFTSLQLTRGRQATFIWLNSLTRWIYKGGM